MCRSESPSFAAYSGGMSELARIEKWANALIALHLDESWSFGFDSAKRRVGACHYSSKRITVSRYLVPLLDDDEIHQTLLHEVAHAMTGPTEGHGAAWKRTARDLGYEGDVRHPGPNVRCVSTPLNDRNTRSLSEAGKARGVETQHTTNSTNRRRAQGRA